MKTFVIVLFFCLARANAFASTSIIIPFTNNFTSSPTIEGLRMEILEKPAWLTVLPSSILGPLKLYPGEKYSFRLDFDVAPKFRKIIQLELELMITHDTLVKIPWDKRVYTYISTDGFKTVDWGAKDIYGNYYAGSRSVRKSHGKSEERFLRETCFEDSPQLNTDCKIEVSSKEPSDIYLGMPLRDFIKAKPKIRSGTTFWDCFEYSHPLCQWIMDPNNIKRVKEKDLKYRFGGFHFKEKIRYPFNEAHYLFSEEKPYLSDVRFEDTIGIIDFREHIRFALKKWGKPDSVSFRRYAINDSTDTILSMSFAGEVKIKVLEIALSNAKPCICKSIFCIDKGICGTRKHIINGIFFPIISGGLRYPFVKVTIQVNPDNLGIKKKVPPYKKPTLTKEDKKLLETIGYYKLLAEVGIE